MWVLLYLIKNESSFVRFPAAEVLGKLSKAYVTIRPEVLQWLEQNSNNDEIGNAIDCLWSIVVE